MTIEVFRDFLAWCTVINLALLLAWILWFTLGHDFVYRVHTKWAKLSEETFDTIHYSGMIFFKAIIITFNLTPYLVLRIFI